MQLSPFVHVLVYMLSVRECVNACESVFISVWERDRVCACVCVCVCVSTKKMSLFSLFMASNKKQKKITNKVLSQFV